jgi:hypothetical protein
MLLSDSRNDTILAQSELGNSSAYYKTSDGSIHNDINTNHIWNALSDKPCALDYKTRYVIVYSESANITCHILNPGVLYMYFGNNSHILSLNAGSSQYGVYSHLLQKIKFENSVTMGSSALTNKTNWNLLGSCYSLQSIDIPNGVTMIDENAFSDCHSLKNVNIPNSVTAIGIRAFSDCRSLKNVNIPNSITSIGGGAFSNCYSLENINIPHGVSIIDWATFSDCYSLKSINIPDSVTSISYNVFYTCYSLENVNIPNSVISIGSGAFSLCSLLESINIPNSVTTIASSAFQYCSFLKNIHISSALTVVNGGLLRNCNSLVTINIAQGWVAPQELYLLHSKYLSISSVRDFFNKLGATSSVSVLRFANEVKSQLSSIDIALVTNKGYTIA